MVAVGYPLLCEQTGPKDLVDHAVRAEAGFTDVAVVQAGGDSQPAFLDWAGAQLVPRLRDL